ncbi:type I phosphomannose isomerase catalytic subunit [[Mycoplasma] mobile]|uniref:Phosphohexomutase n=1 Tax=Mycoplasma mobile (strain ATCC 43663 / 163K / NCTC 11711) TaxID=267748 RepID=Q6KHB6_MYCM1|nr:type I phosphomannose isomerase catalytic subunit [[Mycoplasma] mobile]AAT28014.1 mannose-6-phosphate isomerase [Mycoplasma mobile 163K]
MDKFNLEKIIFLKPYFEEKIWGGNYLKNRFLLNDDSKKIGEAWLISGIEGKENKILNDSTYDLRTLWEQKNYLFNNQKKKYSKFPLLLKILAPEDDLSVQVHPDNEYAKKFDSYGKNESWYIEEILTKKANQVILGHKAKNYKDAKNLIDSKKWDEFFNYVKIEKGDVIDVFPGLVHALLKNIVTFELQQASELTFRLFDYKRKDKDGIERDLHIQESLDNIEFSKKFEIKNFANLKEKNNICKMVDNEFYTFIKLDLEGEFTFPKNLMEKDFLIFFINEGFGKINEIEIKKNDSFIIPSTVKKIKMEGLAKIFIAFNN